MIFLFILLTFSLGGLAQEQPLSSNLAVLKEENDISPKIKCSEISDDFCKKIWNPPFNGNIDLGTSKILLGKSPRSDISMAQILDYQALLISREKLPSDFKKEIKNILRELENVLKREKDDDLWYRNLAKVERKIQDVEFETALMRVRRRLPQFAKIAPKDRNYDENFEFKKDYYDLRAEIIRAKYENSKSWKDVASLFEQVRSWVIDEVQKFSIEASVKEKMISKIKAIRLQFPTEDPRLMSGDPGCGSVQVNAFYMGDRNSLTICAGWFNVLQDETATILVLAHEIAHAIDPVSIARDQLMETEMGGVFKQLCEAKGPVFSCDKWDEIKTNIFKKPQTLTYIPPVLETITQCLKTDQDLKPFKAEDLARVNEDNRRRLLHAFASRNSFSLMTQPQKYEDGKFKPNDFFLRPDRWRIPGSDQLCMAHVEMEMFSQILKCQGYDEKDLKNRSIQFEKSLKELEGLEFAIGQKWIQLCGKDCPELVASRMSRVVHEEFADWVAKKILAKYLEIEKSLEKRREKFGVAASWLCDRPGPYWGASDLTGIEKKWSFESHPDQNIRRLSFITPKVSELLDCQYDERLSGSQQNNRCDFK